MKISKRQSNFFLKRSSKKKIEPCSVDEPVHPATAPEGNSRDDILPENENEQQSTNVTEKKSRSVKGLFRKMKTHKNRKEDRPTTILEEPLVVGEKLAALSDDQHTQDIDTHTVISADSTPDEKVSDEVHSMMSQSESDETAAHEIHSAEDVTVTTGVSRILGCGGLLW
jgi:hypothetical protein